MEKQVTPRALLVSASLTHRVEDLRSALQLPERLLGLHIIEPWNRGSLAEILAPRDVACSAVPQMQDWVAHLEKCGLAVPDQPGGLVMRIWLPALNEAGLLLHEGVAIPTIDEAMRRFGMTYGPLEWMDRLGLDHVKAIMIACESLFTGRITFETGFSLMVEKQWLGYQTDLGFYRRWFGRWKPHHDAELLWRTQSQGENAHPLPSLSPADMQTWIQKRLVTLTVLESIRCLQEGIVHDVNDLDCAMCLTGWATHRGGPIGYARQLGYEAVAATCAELTQQLGVRFAPVASMQEILSRL
jgi:3-hydroxyacyl-CoA dehydrogenase/enoyl-CoA hydratase/3-hydroxybutyryl-CoA epimerase